MSKKRRGKANPKSATPRQKFFLIAALVVLGGCTVYLIHRESIAHAGHPLAISNAGFLPTVP
ncbi:MAG: hypothetical protein WBQ10_12330, partial [Terriglobales bacterium]